MTTTPMISPDSTAAVPSAPTGSPEQPRGTKRALYPLTWLRALAAFSVVTFHAYQHNRSGPDQAWPWSGGAHRAMLGTELFVEMFFVLSAFVLWLPIARTALEGRSGRPGRVLLFRRMARLAPLYFTVVLAVWALTNPSLPGHWQDLLLHLTFTQVYSDQFIFWTNGPAWSLAVEFHFYVLMALSVPLVNAGVRRASSRAGRLAVVLVLPALLTAAGLLYLVWETVWSPAAPDNYSVLFSPISRAADFGIGTGLAVLAAAGARLPGWARGVTAVVGLAALGALVATRPIALIGEWWHPAYALAIAVALTSIVLHDGPWPAALDWRPLTWVGGLGYGIYLIHEPVMRVLGAAGLLPEPRPGAWFIITAVLVAVPSVLLAWVSANTVERAGARVAATIDGRGRGRDYYAHLEPAGRPT
jgi:peptidoglycan/LPS O-acetylase OafA/YrhL